MKLFWQTVLAVHLAVFAALVGGCGADTNAGAVASRVAAQSGARTQVAAPVRQGAAAYMKLVFAGREAVVELYDNPTSRDLQGLLPLTLRFREFGGREKIADPPRSLSVEAAPPRFEPAAGDLALFVPWGNLAVFYRASGPSEDLVPIGRFTSGLEAMANMQGEFVVRLEAVPK